MSIILDTTNESDRHITNFSSFLSETDLPLRYLIAFSSFLVLQFFFLLQ